ncbi:MAG: tRNA lysidine(34) synthetase TilS [Chloroflexota bacterium]
MLSQKISQVLNSFCQLEPQAVLLIGVSGGPDSLSLMHMLHQMGLNLIPAHLDHCLRSESADEAREVAQISEEWGMHCVQGKVDVAKAAKEQGQSIEEAARECRYRFLFEQAEQVKAVALVVAHTADDQVETVLMHLLRGAGMGGLKGMTYREIFPQWSTVIPLVRPMLGVWRTEVLNYCNKQGLAPLFDRSNFDKTYFRNRLRHDLLPRLETYNPQVRQVIWRMAEVLRGDEELLIQLSQNAWQDCLSNLEKGLVTLIRERFLGLPLGLKRRVLRMGLDLLRPNLRDIGMETIDRAVEAVQSPPVSGRLDLIAHLDLVVEDDMFFIKEKAVVLPLDEWPQIPQGEIIFLTSDSEIELNNSWFLSARLLEHTEYLQLEPHQLKDPNQAWLAADKLAFPLVIRGRKSGDRWQPFGMHGHSQKISNFFINEKIPEKARDGWPLVTQSETILWVAGIRSSHLCPLKGSEEKVMNLRLSKRPSK